MTIAELLKSGGYATACIGKWHLGFQQSFLPSNQGFDHYFGLLHNLDPVEVGDKYPARCRVEFLILRTLAPLRESLM